MGGHHRRPPGPAERDPQERDAEDQTLSRAFHHQHQIIPTISLKLVQTLLLLSDVDISCP